MSDNSDIENQVNQALDDSIENLSPDIQRQLNRMRIEATQPKRTRLPMWQTAAAFSVMLAVVAGWLMMPQTPEMPLEPFAEVLEEDLDMLDDLEFAYWMAEEAESAAL